MNALDISAPEYNLPASVGDALSRSTHRRRGTVIVEERIESEPGPNRCNYQQQRDFAMSDIMEESMVVEAVSVEGSDV